jgi:Uncharacterized protein conserved in bacteria
MKNLYIIAGCNGAGKTTASYTVLPEMLKCKEFVNADEIAKGLSPFRPENVIIQAGRIMLKRIGELLSQDEDFAFETTLATRTYVNLVKKAQMRGYSVTLLYFWLNSPELALERVKKRVKAGGHGISFDTIIRRYYAGIKNFKELYTPIVDYWMLVNNSESPFEVVADSSNNQQVYNQRLYDIIINV